MASNSTRTVMRLNVGAFLPEIHASDEQQSVAEREANTIYYLMTHAPHEHDFSCFGPFHSRRAFVPSLLNKLHEKSPSALEGVVELLESPGGLDGFEHVVAPLPNNKTMRVYLEKQENAEVKRILPGPVWHVLRSHTLDRTHPERQESLDVCGIFTTAEAANRRAREVIREAAAEARGRPMERLHEGLVVGAVLAGQKMVMVETRFESGEVVG